MHSRPAKTLFVKLQRKGFWPQHAAEVGVYIPETSNIFDYIVAGVRTTLVEPDPQAIRRINESFGQLPGVTLHQLAAFDFTGTLDLSQRDASTFVSQLESSPAIVNDGYVVSDADQFTVQCTTFDKLDDGSIDLISIDTEGSEWYVLKYMLSRPDVISIETHGAAYRNPHLGDIEEWMATNDYRLFYMDKTDSVYVRNGRIALSVIDRLRLKLQTARLAMRRIRKRGLGGSASSLNNSDYAS